MITSLEILTVVKRENHRIGDTNSEFVRRHLFLNCAPVSMKQTAALVDKMSAVCLNKLFAASSLYLLMILLIASTIIGTAQRSSILEYDVIVIAIALPRNMLISNTQKGQVSLTKITLYTKQMHMMYS